METAHHSVVQHFEIYAQTYPNALSSCKQLQKFLCAGTLRFDGAMPRHQFLLRNLPFAPPKNDI